MIQGTMRGLGFLAGSVSLIATSVAVWAAVADAATTCDGLPATIVGTQGNDTLTGTAGDDVIAGLDGDDTIAGLDGNDRICGGGGRDTVYGDVEVRSAGLATGDNDWIFGEGDNDTLIGDFGSASVPGGGGAGGGNDYIDGGQGVDVIAGGYLNVTVTVTAVTAALTPTRWLVATAPTPSTAKASR